MITEKVIDEKVTGKETIQYMGKDEDTSKKCRSKDGYSNPNR